MKNTESVKDHYEMSVDSIGMPLNYRILIQDWSVKAILYKYQIDSEIKELPFKEIKFDSSKLYQTDSEMFGLTVVLA